VKTNNIPAPSNDQWRANKLLDIYRGEVDDYFKIWPPDKKYFFSKDGRSFIAYGVKFKVAICYGDPNGPEDGIGDCLKEFKNYCYSQGLKMAFIQTTDKFETIYKKIALHRILIGADAVIDLKNFVTTTVHNKYFRNIVNRFSKKEFVVLKYLPPHKEELIKELKKISDNWLKLPHHKEWNFLTGRFDNDYLQQVPVFVIRDGHGKAWAFANQLPSYKLGVSTVDLMRRFKNAPPNITDYLFIEMMKQLKNDGYSAFNLGMSPIDGRPFAKTVADKILIFIYGTSNRFIGFRGLHQFKAKYKPAWDDRYVWYEGSPIYLFKYGLAISRLIKSK